MTVHKDLQSASTLTDIANLLGFKPKALSYIIYHMPPATKYTTFQIAKKNGGLRTIKAPCAQLKLLQKRLNAILQQTVLDIKSIHPRTMRASHGFMKGRSIITNASPHVNRRIIVNLDLEDFFDCINFGRVRGALIKHKDLTIQDKVATIIAQIGCFDNALPQGSPCSPILANIVASSLDGRLNAFASRRNLCYTRYADDITFSTNNKTLPAELGSIKPDGSFLPSPNILKELNKSGFKANLQKVVAHVRGNQQHVTGLIVNEKINVSQAYWRNTRAMCHTLYTGGVPYRNASFKDHKRGPAWPAKEASIEGRLGYIYSIRSLSDKRPIAEQHEHQLGITKEYRRFLFRKHFVTRARPLILCEGKTDSVYLKCALRAVGHKHPELVNWKLGNSSCRVQFFKYSKASEEIMRLAGGTSFLCDLLREYKARYSSYAALPSQHPVIILIDNDDGAKCVFGLMSKKPYAPVKPTKQTTDDFYYAGDNLYIVKTMENGSLNTKIEDCFDPSLLSKKLGSAVFNPDKKHDAPNEYGKHIFAREIVEKNAASISFANFSPLFDRLEAAIVDYKARKISGIFL